MDIEPLRSISSICQWASSDGPGREPLRPVSRTALAALGVVVPARANVCSPRLHIATGYTLLAWEDACTTGNIHFV